MQKAGKRVMTIITIMTMVTMVTLVTMMTMITMVTMMMTKMRWYAIGEEHCSWNCSMTQLCKNLLDDIFTILMMMKMMMLMTITCYFLQAQLIRDQLIIWWYDHNFDDENYDYLLWLASWISWSCDDMISDHWSQFWRWKRRLLVMACKLDQLINDHMMI